MSTNNTNDIIYITIKIPRINVVRQSFQRQIQRIEDRRTLLTDTKKSLNLDLSILSKGQEEHDRKMEKLRIMKMKTSDRCERILNDVAELSRAISAVYNTHTSQVEAQENEMQIQASSSLPLSSDKSERSRAEKNGSDNGNVSEIADERDIEKVKECREIYYSAAAHLKEIDEQLCIAMKAQVNYSNALLSCVVFLFFVLFIFFLCFGFVQLVSV